MACRTREKDAEKRLQSVHDSKLNHQRQVHQSELVVQDEQSRRLRVRKHLLQDDVDSLRLKLAEKDTQLQQLSSDLDQARMDADSERSAQGKSQKRLQLQNRELAQLKAELHSINTTTEDSAKHLTEKLAFAREIANLKPEVEHLRSQLVHHQVIIAEKLSLERQLNTAEVELAAEKKARQDAARRDHETQDIEDELRRQLKDFEKKLASEKRETDRMRRLAESQAAQTENDVSVAEQELRSKLQHVEQQLLAERRDKERAAKDADVSLGEAQAKIDMLEQRLDSMRSKLRSTQSELKSLQAMQEPTRATKPGDKKLPTRPSISKPQVGKKRAAQEMSVADKSLDSPDSDDDISHKAAKKRSAETTLLGEKSLFSVTPFLNRNKTLSMDALLEEDEADTSHIPQNHVTHPPQQQSSGDSVALKRTAEPPKDAEATRAKVGRPRGRPRKVLADSSTNISISSTTAEKGGQATLPVSTNATGISPEMDRDLAPEVTQAVKPTAVVAKASSAKVEATSGEDAGPKKRDPDLKKKKRKLVADTSKTIFDEPEVETVEPKVKRTSKVQLHGPAKAMGKQKMGMSRHAFGGSTFSPLKKDRRGVGASFLA